MTVYLWLACVLALMALAIALINRFSWPRGENLNALDGSRVSVLVPARNESRNIEACVRSVFVSLPDVHEVVVYDDQSTDDTPHILAQLQTEYSALRVVHGVPLPSDWVGKPHACARLAEHAHGELLVFVDADVTFCADGFARLGDLFARYSADLVTAVPHQEMRGPMERLVLPLLHLTYLSWLPQFLVHRSRDPRFLAANGQLLALRADTYRAIGGFGSVRAEIVDDMAICRLTKQSGAKVVFADGDRIASCHMYPTAADVWAGFSKNLYEGIGGTPLALLLVVALYITTFVAPWFALPAAYVLDHPTWVLPAALGVFANLAQRLLQASRHRQPAVTVLLHVASIFAFVMLALNSWRWTRSNRVQWSGRTYVARQNRAGAA